MLIGAPLLIVVDRLCRILILFWVFLGTRASFALEIDNFDYASAPAIRDAWRRGGDSPQAGVAQAGAWGSERLGEFRCDFSKAARERCYWDRSISFDLSQLQCFAIRLYCSNPDPISEVTLYFHSQDGWYAQSLDVSQPGWNLLVFQKWEFGTEGDPAGWDRIDAIRFSPWRASRQDTVLYLDRLFAYSPDVCVVRGTKTVDANPGAEIDGYIRPFVEWLTQYGMTVAQITDEDVESGSLTGSRLAILPYNPVMSDAECTRISELVEKGGKLWGFYDLDERITALLGIDVTGWNDTDVCALRVTGKLPGLPRRVNQASWNFMEVKPTSASTRTLAMWETCDGEQLEYPALLNGAHGSYLSHVLLIDDPLAKQQMLLALLVRDVPERARDAAKGALDRAGEVALYRNFDQAYAQIAALGPLGLNPEEVAAALAKARSAWDKAQIAFRAERYPAVLSPAFAARRALIEAYALAQRPLSGEYRALWNHSGTGLWPGDWQRSAAQIKASGFGAVFPNMLWGGLAHYPSALLPRSEEYRLYGDQIAQCVAACKPLGLETHIWKVNWNLSSAPAWFIKQMRDAKRTQVDVDGKDIDWLCPSNPLNRALERDSLMEVVRGYDVNGIHFDYIRYPDETTCYCTGCRRRFEADRGAPVLVWPDDCYDGALRNEYRDWRAQQITQLVREVHDAAKAIKPEIRISAAVFPDYPDCRESIGQDWLAWIQSGLLDFVMPMDYTSDADSFADTVERQIRQVGGRVPVYPGIGASSEPLALDQVIVQILETRRQMTGGFTIFNYDESLKEILPWLAQGTTYAGDDGGSIGARIPR